MKALLVDAYDSFVYVIYQYLKQLKIDVDIKRNDKLTIEDISSNNYHFIVLGPGPGHPADANYLPIIENFKDKLPILGVCLGHQAIGLAFGASIIEAAHLKHGKTSLIMHDSKGVFSSFTKPFIATRYHSLIIDKKSLTDELIITATDADDEYIMGIRHVSKPIESLQFHPESICTEHGINLFKNFINEYVQ